MKGREVMLRRDPFRQPGTREQRDLSSRFEAIAVLVAAVFGWQLQGSIQFPIFGGGSHDRRG